MTKGIYLDNSMTAKPSEAAVASMLPFLTQMWGVPTQPHQMGQELFFSMKESYQAIYALLQAKESDRFILTSSGSEAVNHVFLSAYLDITDPTGKNQYITSAIDEAASLMSLSRLEQLGCISKMIKPNSEGVVSAKSIADAITPRTALVSLSYANGLTGVINPIDEIAALCQSRGIALHIDVTHVLGRIFFDLSEIKPTFLTFNGDHLHTPKGIGGLYIKEGVKCSPFIAGGMEQGALRSGSLNVASLAALGIAAKELIDASDFVCTEIARLRNKFEEEIEARVKDATIFFKSSPRIPTIACIGFKGIPNELMLYHLNRKNLFASIGGGSFQQIGLILGSSLVEKSLGCTAINFSLSRYTTEDEIEKAVDIIVTTAMELKKLSSHIN